MIKKLLSAIAVIAITATVAQAQPCTPNVLYADSSAGVWPDTFPPACKDDPNGYNLVVDVVTLTDTCVQQPIPNFCVYIKGLRINSVTGMPAGFVYAPAYNTQDEGGYWLNGGVDPNWTPVQGCVLISAPQSAVQNATTGTSTITVTVDLLAKAQNPQSPILQNYTWLSTLGMAVDYSFPFEVKDICGNAVNELDATKFSVAPNFPNPFSGNTIIPINTVKEENVTVKVYNMLGALVHQTAFQSKVGKNLYAFNASTFAPGVYIYSISNGKETLTRKMTIN